MTSRRAGAVALFVCLGVTGCRTSAEAIRRHAEARYAAAEWADAEIQYRKLIAAAPEDATAHFRLGEAYLKQGKFPQAYESLQRAASLPGDSVPAQNLLAELLLSSYRSNVEKLDPVRRKLWALADKLSGHPQAKFQTSRIRGVLAADVGRLHEARQHFTAAHEMRTDDADTATLLMDVLVRLQTAEEAERIGLAFVSRHPVDGAVSRALTALYLRQGRVSEAERVLTSLKGASTSESVQLQLAELYRAARRTSDMEAVLARLASSAELRNGKFAAATFYERHGRLDEALQLYADSAASAPSGVAQRSRKRQVALLIGVARFNEARTVLDAVPEAWRSDVELLRARALIFEHFGELKEARSTLNGALVAAPQDASLRYESGTMYLRAGDHPKAEADLRGALRLGADSHSVGIALASAAIARRDYAAALRAVESVLEQHPDDEVALLSRVSALRGLRRTAEAQSILNVLQRRNPANPALPLESAWLLLDQGRAASAEAAFGKLHAAGNHGLRVVAGYAEALSRQGKLRETIQLLRSDLRRVPGRPMIVFALGEALAGTGDFAGAAESFRKLIELNPTAPVGYQKLAAVYSSEGKAGEALSVLKQGLSRVSEQKELVSACAQIAQMAKDTHTADQYYREWMRLDPSNPIPRNNLAYLLAEQRERLPEALTLAQAAVRSRPSDRKFLDTLAFVQARSGNLSESDQIYRSLKRQNSHSTSAQ